MLVSYLKVLVSGARQALPWGIRFARGEIRVHQSLAGRRQLGVEHLPNVEVVQLSLRTVKHCESDLCWILIEAAHARP